MSELTDSELVAAVLEGGSEAFGELVRRYQDRVYAVAVGVLADFHLSRDAAQEAFLCAYCQLARLRDPSRLGAWLCGIARNTAFEIRRDRTRQDRLTKQAQQLAAAAEPAPSAAQLAVAGEQRRQVQQALERLGQTDREALVLRYVDGLDYAQICGFLGVSTGTLKGRLQRGRRALRKELAMVQSNCRSSLPDDSFAQRLEEVVRVFGAKGPATHHIHSPWQRSMLEETRRIVRDGEEGLRIDLALSHSGSGRHRYHTATRLGLRKDDRSLEVLERLLDDRSARVRRQALRWYAVRIRPGTGEKHPCGPSKAAAALPAHGFESLLQRMSDANFNVRLAAVQAVGAYRAVGAERVEQALRRALEDPKHKVRHAASAILRVPCPGCGRTW